VELITVCINFTYNLKAPGEAEAELAYLNQIHAIDLVLTSDSDVFMFGATHVIRRSAFLARFQ
jgi:holliday junction resolvase YEN1